MPLTVARVGAQGDGLAPLPEGGQAVLPFTLPGETVAPGDPPRILTPSPERVAPPCPHFGICGACALQHWADAPYAAWKRGLLVQALARAGFPDAPVGSLARTPAGDRRRADLGLWREPEGHIVIGFHPRGDTRPLAIRACPVLNPALLALLPALAEALRPITGLRRAGGLLVNMLDSGPDLLLRTDGPLTQPDRQRLAAFAAAHGIPRIAWTGPQGVVEVAAQLAPVRHALSGVTVSPPPGAFLQASTAGEAAIIAAVRAALPPKLSRRARIADLYAGIGTLSLPLAAHGVVEAFEGDAGAAAALKGAHPRVTSRHRDLARQPLLPAEIKGYAVLVLDPPFAGAPAQVAQLARSAARHVVYVSCNPAVLARDAAVLRGAGFAVAAATPIDQFLWSAQLEAVVAFARA